MTEHTIRTTNLLYAAVLLTDGAEVLMIKSGPKFSEIFLDVSQLNREHLSQRLQKLAISMQDVDNFPDVTAVIDNSIMGDIDDKYIRLKRAVIGKRGHAKD